MDFDMLEGWTPILLIGIVFALVIFLLSFKVSRKMLFKVSGVLSLLCFVTVIYSIVIIGGWEGMGIGAVTVCIFIGIWIGTVLGITFKKQR